MTNYTLSLTNAQDKALSYVCNSQEEWINNAVAERCRLAIEDISKIALDKCFEQNVQVPNSKEDLVLLAFERGWVVAAVDVVPRSETTV